MNAFEVLGGRLSELAALLAITTQPGHFNKHPWYRQCQVAKDEQRFEYTDQQCAPLVEYLRFNSANGRIVYK